MKNSRRLGGFLMLALLLAAGPTAARAQGPPAVRKTILPSLDSQVAARLIALDRRLNPTHTPNLAAGLAAQLAVSGTPLDVFTPLFADQHNQDVWEQLPEEYYRMTQESGDALVTLTESPPHLGVGWSSGQVRRICHQRLAALPRVSLETYRQRVDAEAKALLEQGRRERSPVPLRRLVDDLFCSSPGDRALDLLGDLAFEKGQFDEARHWWSLLAPLDGERDDRLLFPHPQVDLARVQAKQILALIFQGRLDEAQSAVPGFLYLHAKAKGSLAGKDDAYGVILQKTLDSFAKERLRNNDEPWTTFGGDAQRNRTLSQGLTWQLWEDGPAWRVPLPALNARDAPPDRAQASRRAAFHPVIVNHQVLIADHRSVVSYHLTTGKELFRYESKAPGLADVVPGIDAKIALPRFTLSADHERAYVTLGKLGMGPNQEAASWLVCLDLKQPDAAKKRELWRVRANAEDKSPAFFEGSPLVHDGRVYIALSKIAGRRVMTSIVCYDVHGRQRWTREVCDCPEFEEHPNGPRYRQHLLTLAGGQLVYCSNAGAIVAVDAWTGQPAWGVRYPSRGPLTQEHEPSPRDLAPALYADGLVFAAPVDCDRVFCLDAVTGRLRWELDGVEIVHLLGAGHGKLVAATRHGVMSVHSATGQIDWTQPTEGRLPSLGRGLIAGGWLIWPTQDAKLPYRAVTLRGGTQQKDGEARSVLPEADTMDPAMLHTLPVGNLAFGEGCLVIAGLSELVVYVPGHKMKDLPPPDTRPQTRLETLYQKARRLASAGRDDESAEAYRRLLDETKTHSHAADWRALIECRLGPTSREAERPEGVTTTKAAPKVKLPPVSDGPALPLVRAWSQQDGRVWPTDADEYRDEFFFCTQPGQMTCRSLADGTLRWQTKLKFEPAWLGRWRDLVLIAGPDAVQAMHVDNGKAAWWFAAPSRRWRLASVQKGTPKLLSPAAGIVHAERWDDTLLICDDHRCFYRLRLDTGAIDWQYAAPGAALRPLGAAAFAPFMTRVVDRLWAQSVTGQPYWIRDKASPTGMPSRPWLQAPLLIGNGVVMAADGGRVGANGKTPPHERLWEYQAPWPTSLTGDLCRLYNKGSVLLALVPRNDGCECVRLDPARGTVVWSISARHLPADLASLCIGDLSFYSVHDGKLHARSLNDGSLQWTQTLPTRSPSCQVRYTKNYLTVYPGSGARDDEFCIAFIDPWDGSLMQRLTFPDARGPGEVLLTPRHVLVSAGGAIFGFRSLDRE